MLGRLAALPPPRAVVGDRRDAERDLAPPTSFADLADPAYAGQLVVQNAATSSPGLAFLLATIHEYGLDGWQDADAKPRLRGRNAVPGHVLAQHLRMAIDGDWHDLGPGS